jgi:hypothetical protein
MDQHVMASIADEVTVPWHSEIAGIFSIERHRKDGAALEGPGFSMRELDDSCKSQLAQERRVIIVQAMTVLTAWYDHWRVFRKVQQCSRIDVIVVVVRKKDCRGFWEQGGPERRDGRFRKPREEPGIKEKRVVPLSV